MTGILVVGESVVDVVHRADGTSVEYAGGSAANVSVALARLGRPVELLTAFGDDERGAKLARHLNQSAVGLAADPHTLARTATALATIADDGSATYTFDMDWRIGPVPDIAPRAVHACSIGAVLEPGATDVRALLERLRPAATIGYDVNARPAITGTGPDLVAHVERVVGLCDLVKASDEDLGIVYPGSSVDAAAARLLSLGPAAVVVTRGESGSSWYSAAGRVDEPAVTAEVADTIGAGDTFGAGVLDALWEQDVLGGRLPVLEDGAAAAVLRHAARAAAVTVSRPGAEPPYRHEL